MVSSVPNESKRSSPRLGKGYIVAIAGLALFIIAVFAGAMFKVEGAAASVLLLGSFFLMGLAFWVGTALVALDKGYHIIVGIILGFFAPLGLLVITLMPDRK